MKFDKHIANAKSSSFGLWKLNYGLSRRVPFNRPHGIKIKKLEDDKVISIIPLKKKNMNHIKGVHACGMATCAEFASGFLLLTKLDPRKYRLIMESLSAEYHYQAKTDIVAVFEADDNWIKEMILDPLNEKEKVLVEANIKLYDTSDNHVATVRTNWQVKGWDKVKTAL